MIFLQLLKPNTKILTFPDLEAATRNHFWKNCSDSTEICVKAPKNIKIFACGALLAQYIRKCKCLKKSKLPRFKFWKPIIFLFRKFRNISSFRYLFFEIVGLDKYFQNKLQLDPTFFRIPKSYLENRPTSLTMRKFPVKCFEKICMF